MEAGIRLVFRNIHIVTMLQLTLEKLLAGILLEERFGCDRTV